MIPPIPTSEHPRDFQPFAAQLKQVVRSVLYGNGDADWEVELATIAPDQPVDARALSRFRIHSVPWIRRPGQEPVRIVFEGDAPFGETSIRISYVGFTELPYFDHLGPGTLAAGVIVDQD